MAAGFIALGGLLVLLKPADEGIGIQGRYTLRREFPVRTRRDDDVVLAARRDRDQGRSGRNAAHDLAMREIHVTFTQQRKGLVRRRIVADARVEADVGTEPSRRQRLVRALAARKAIQLRTRHGLARRGQFRRLRNDVQIDRTNDRNRRHAQSPNRSMRSASRS